MEFTDGEDEVKVWMACVMDGHGPLGHVMSNLVMQWLPLLILRDPKMATPGGRRLVSTDPLAVLSGVSSAFSRLGALLARASSGSLDREMSGTTCVFVLCAGGLLHSANVGDSRAVLGAVRADPSAYSLRVDARALTRDHKPEDVEERRRLESKGGFVNGQRVWLSEWPFVGLNMSRSLGDSLVHAVGVSDVPDVATTFLDEVRAKREMHFHRGAGQTVPLEAIAATPEAVDGEPSSSSSSSSSSAAGVAAPSDAACSASAADIPADRSGYEAEDIDRGVPPPAGERGLEFLLLASDGVWEFMSNDEAATCVAAQLQGGPGRDGGVDREAAQTSALRLKARATARWREETDELDDITTVVVRLA